MKKQIKFILVLFGVFLILNSYVVLANVGKEGGNDFIQGNCKIENVSEIKNSSELIINRTRDRIENRLEEQKQLRDKMNGSLQENLKEKKDLINNEKAYQFEETKINLIRKMEGGKEKLKLKFESLEDKDYEVESELEIQQDYEGEINSSKLKIKLSNGRNAEIKVMPVVASKTALTRLGMKYCGEETNCSIKLKEVKTSKSNQTQVAYEFQTKKKSRVIGLFSVDMPVEAKINAETGELIEIKKPWWAFLAREKIENQIDNVLE